MALTVEDIKVINWTEEWWLRKKSFPPVDAFESFFPKYSLKEALKNEIFLKALNNRGIKLPENNTKLDNEQLAAIAVMANFRDPRSPTVKLKSIGVSWTKWQGWMKDKYFKEFLQDLCAVNFEDSIDVAQAGILKGVEKGNVDSVKLYLELTGRYTPQSQEVVNLKLILSRLLETIQIHVKDPIVLRNIAGDFEKVIAGGTPTVPKELQI
jgi:hypothetical protein